MNRLAATVGAVVLLVSSHELPSAEVQNRSAPRISVGLVIEDFCEAYISAPPKEWRASLSCIASAERPNDVRSKVAESSIWLLLTDGKAAAPVAPAKSGPTVGFGTCGVGVCSLPIAIDFDFEGREAPTVVVVRYGGKFYTFPITKEHLLKAVTP
jgi:hypothetical protein